MSLNSPEDLDKKDQELLILSEKAQKLCDASKKNIETKI